MECRCPNEIEGIDLSDRIKLGQGIIITWIAYTNLRIWGNAWLIRGCLKIDTNYYEYFLKKIFKLVLYR